ncbi:GNAT family N-acetyltransferase [Kangiella sp. HD9-110m-PIT-SAG07]|nr:GNAT family N-acetyltransferase [Kangiella sp. HD9-110m-PIT-SAG07]
MKITIKSVDIEDIYPLRHQVLRSGQPIETCYYPEDERAGVFHIAAYIGDDIVGIASFYPEQQKVLKAQQSWRLRGMATAESVRGQGVGKAILLEGIEYCRQKGADLLWCNARASASGFYCKLNFAILGEAFIIDNIGPHYLMYYEY